MSCHLRQFRGSAVPAAPAPAVEKHLAVPSAPVVEYLSPQIRLGASAPAPGVSHAAPNLAVIRATTRAADLTQHQL